jgi:hypothetical protein
LLAPYFLLSGGLFCASFDFEAQSFLSSISSVDLEPGFGFVIGEGFAKHMHFQMLSNVSNQTNL